jgi:hypothetical protein
MWQECGPLKLVQQLKRDGQIPGDTPHIDSIQLHDISIISGLHPVEAVLYGALLPVLKNSKSQAKQKSKEDMDEANRRFRVAEYLLRFLLDEKAKGPHKKLALNIRKDSPNLIVCTEGAKATRKRVFWAQLGLHSRFTPVDVLVFTLGCLVTFDPDLVGKSAKENEQAGVLPSGESSVVLRIARL